MENIVSTFTRRIAPSRLTTSTVDDNHWFRELLLCWRPSGVSSERTTEGKVSSLRLAVRDGYLSFYCAGNQIAYVRCTQNSFFEKAHYKYLNLPMQVGDSNLRITPPSREMAKYELHKRVQRSFIKQGGEKDFVDEVVGSNSSIFDLELALSYLRPDTAKRVALRLDAASLEPDDHGWRIALWEAKLAENNGARAIKTPATIAQHAAYSEWFTTDGNADAFIEGCRASCRYLVQLHKLAIHAGNSAIVPLNEGIMEVGSNPDAQLSLDTNVRYIIDARGKKGDSFSANGHDKKLKNLGIQVQVIRVGDPMVLGPRGA